MAYQVDKFELVELQVQSTSTATRYFFPDLPKLRAKMVTSIETFFGTEIYFSPSGRPLVDQPILLNSYLVFYTNGTQDLWRLPWMTLNRTQGFDPNTAISTPFVHERPVFRPQSITWDKSYVELGTTPTFTTNCSFMLGVYYS